MIDTQHAENTGIMHAIKTAIQSSNHLSAEEQVTSVVNQIQHDEKLVEAIAELVANGGYQLAA